MRVAVLALLLASLGFAADPVLLASRRGGTIEAFHPGTLDSVARIHIDGMLESVASDPDGGRLYVRLPRPEEPRHCCGLFALDTAGMKMSLLVWPSDPPALSPTKIYTQRGNVGIEAIDSRSLTRLPALKAPSIYQLQPSPDGRWIFGATANTQPPSVDIFDATTGALVHHLPIEGAQTLRGAFIGNQYYLLASDSPVSTRIWALNPDQPILGTAKLVSFAAAGYGVAVYNIIPAGNRLIVFEQFGMKGDRRHTDDAPGGFLSLDPSTGVSTSRLAPAAHCRQIVSNPDGSSLYCLNVGDPEWRQVSILKLDGATGAVLAQKALPPDVWFLSIGAIRHNLAGRFDLAAQAQTEPRQ